jgi:hypothetical protein
VPSSPPALPPTPSLVPVPSPLPVLPSSPCKCLDPQRRDVCRLGLVQCTREKFWRLKRDLFIKRGRRRELVKWEVEHYYTAVFNQRTSLSSINVLLDTLLGVHS